MLFDQLIDIPPGAELFSNGDWDFDLLPKRTIDRRILRTNKVFGEEWLQWFDERTQADRIGEVEPRMIVDAPVASRPDSVTYLNTIVIGLAHHLTGVEGVVAARIGNRTAEGAETRFDCCLRRLLDAAPIGNEACRVAL